MAILLPVNVERFHCNSRHPHHNPDLAAESVHWIVYVDGEEIKHCIGFDRKNGFAKFLVVDERGMVKLRPQKVRGRGRELIAMRKGVVTVFRRTDNDANA